MNQVNHISSTIFAPTPWERLTHSIYSVFISDVCRKSNAFQSDAFRMTAEVKRPGLPRTKMVLDMTDVIVNEELGIKRWLIDGSTMVLDGCSPAQPKFRQLILDRCSPAQPESVFS